VQQLQGFLEEQQSLIENELRGAKTQGGPQYQALRERVRAVLREAEEQRAACFLPFNSHSLS